MRVVNIVAVLVCVPAALAERSFDECEPIFKNEKRENEACATRRCDRFKVDATLKRYSECLDDCAARQSRAFLECYRAVIEDGRQRGLIPDYRPRPPRETDGWTAAQREKTVLDCLTYVPGKKTYCSCIQNATERHWPSFEVFNSGAWINEPIRPEDDAQFRATVKTCKQKHGVPKDAFP
jgi:hypothetical protein